MGSPRSWCIIIAVQLRATFRGIRIGARMNPSCIFCVNVISNMVRDKNSAQLVLGVVYVGPDISCCPLERAGACIVP